MKPDDWINLAKTVAGSGKQVVISTLALLQAPSELKEIAKLVDNGEFMIEAHDFGVINMLHERGLPFVAGHGLNCYNAGTENSAKTGDDTLVHAGGAVP